MYDLYIIPYTSVCVCVCVCARVCVFRERVGKGKRKENVVSFNYGLKCVSGNVETWTF